MPFPAGYGVAPEQNAYPFLENPLFRHPKLGRPANLENRIYRSLGLRDHSGGREFIFLEPQRSKMKRIIAKFLADETGATAIEYGLIAAGISIAIIVAVNGLGSNLNTMFNSINTSLK